MSTASQSPPKRGTSVEPTSDESKGSWLGRFVGALTSFGLLAYLPLRALQEGFYDSFGLTGGDVGLNEATVLTRAAVVGSVFVGLGLIIIIPAMFIGHAIAARVDRLLLRVGCLIVLALLGEVLPLASPPPDQIAAFVPMVFIFMAVCAAPFALYDLGEALTDWVTDWSGIAKVAGLFIPLTVLSLTAFTWGTDIGAQVKAGGGRSFANLLVLSQPATPVSVIPLSTLLDEPIELPEAGIFLGESNGAALVYADRTVYRLPLLKFAFKDLEDSITIAPAN